MSLLSSTDVTLAEKGKATGVIGLSLLFTGLVQAFYFLWIFPTFFALEGESMSMFGKFFLRTVVHTMLKKFSLEVNWQTARYVVGTGVVDEGHAFLIHTRALILLSAFGRVSVGPIASVVSPSPLLAPMKDDLYLRMDVD